MLRLTKGTIELTRRRKFFSPELKKGLAIALAFHLALLGTFRIAKITSSDSLLPLLPISVEIDLGKPLPLILPSPLSSSPIEHVEPPQLLDLPHTVLHAPPSSFYELTFHEPDFSEIEYIPYEPYEDEDDDDCD